jgi:hypothetical protein
MRAIMRDTLKHLEEASARLDAALQESAALLGRASIGGEPTPPPDGRTNVTRAEFERLVRIVAARTPLLEQFLREQKIQFTRLAQLQAQIDGLERRCDRYDARRSPEPARHPPRKRRVR